MRQFVSLVSSLGLITIMSLPSLSLLAMGLVSTLMRFVGDTVDSDERFYIPQFCGNDPQTILEAARYAEPYCDAVDLNLGCPQSVARKGEWYWSYAQTSAQIFHTLGDNFSFKAVS